MTETDKEKLEAIAEWVEEMDKMIKKETAHFDDDVDYDDQMLNLPEHTKKLVDTIGLIMGNIHWILTRKEHVESDNNEKKIKES